MFSINIKLNQFGFQENFVKNQICAHQHPVKIAVLVLCYLVTNSSACVLQALKVQHAPKISKNVFQIRAMEELVSTHMGLISECKMKKNLNIFSHIYINSNKSGKKRGSYFSNLKSHYSSNFNILKFLLQNL